MQLSKSSLAPIAAISITPILHHLGTNELTGMRAICRVKVLFFEMHMKRIEEGKGSEDLKETLTISKILCEILLFAVEDILERRYKETELLAAIDQLVANEKAARN